MGSTRPVTSVEEKLSYVIIVELLGTEPSQCSGLMRSRVHSSLRRDYTTRLAVVETKLGKNRCLCGVLTAAGRPVREIQSRSGRAPPPPWATIMKRGGGLSTAGIIK